MNKIKRYDCYATGLYGEPTIDWEEDETGEYIKSEDFDKYDKKQKARIADIEAENRELILYISGVKRPNEKAEDTKVSLIARVLKREKDNDGAGYWCCKADFGYHEKTCKNYEEAKRDE